MKTVSLTVLAFIVATIATFAQTNLPKIGIGLQADVFNIALNSDLEQKSMGAFASLSFSPKFDFFLESRSNVILNPSDKSYTAYNAGLLGMGYTYRKTPESNHAYQIRAMYGNTLSKANAYGEHSVDLGINSYHFNSFYLGTGVSYYHLDNADFTGLADANFSWYCRMGYHLRFSKKD